jgi:hypothetical protein
MSKHPKKDVSIIGDMFLQNCPSSLKLGEKLSLNKNLSWNVIKVSLKSSFFEKLSILSKKTRNLDKIYLFYFLRLLAYENSSQKNTCGQKAFQLDKGPKSKAIW